MKTKTGWTFFLFFYPGSSFTGLWHMLLFENTGKVLSWDSRSSTWKHFGKTSHSCPPPLHHRPTTRQDECLGTLVPVVQQHIGTRQQSALQAARRSVWEKQGGGGGGGVWGVCRPACENIFSLFCVELKLRRVVSHTPNCNNTEFYGVVLTFQRLDCGPGTVTLVITYWAAG